MTVIALINFDEAPVLISDMMISIDHPGSSIQVPTLGDTNRFSLPFSVVKLRRKLVQINDHCVLGFAGVVADADDFISALKEASQNEIITREIFESTYYNFDEQARKEIGLIGYSWDTLEKEGHWFYSAALELNLPYFGRCLIAGSGAVAFSEWLTIVADEHANSKPSTDYFEKASDQAYSILGRLIQLDSFKVNGETAPTSIVDTYGGWYEAYFLTRDKFKSVTDTVFFDILDSEGNFSLTRFYLNKVSKKENEVVSAAIMIPIIGEKILDRIAFRLPLEIMDQYIISHIENHLGAANKVMIEKLLESLDTGVCHLMADFNWTEEKILQAAGDPHWEILDEKGTASQRFVEFHLKDRSGNTPFNIHVSESECMLSIRKDWIQNKATRLHSNKTSILLNFGKPKSE